MAQGLNTGIGVGQAQVLDPYQVKGQGESPFAYIAKKRDIAEEQRKAEGQKYRDAFLRMKAPSLEGTHYADKPLLAKVAAQFHQAIQESNMNGTMARDYADIERKFDEISAMVALSKDKWKIQQAKDADRKQHGQDSHYWMGNEHYDALSSRYDDTDYNISNTDKWLEVNSRLAQNAEQNVGTLEKFPLLDYQAKLAAQTRSYAATHGNETFNYDPTTGIAVSNSGLTYSGKEKLDNFFNASPSAQMYFQDLIKNDADLQKKYGNTFEGARKLFYETNKDLADISKQGAKIKMLKPDDTNISVSGGGGGWVEDGITFVPNKISSGLVADKIKDIYNAEVGKDDEENKKKDPNFVSKTVTDLSQIPGVRQADVDALNEGRIKQVTFSKKGEKPLNLKTGNGAEEVPMVELSIAKFGNDYYITGTKVLGVNSDGVTLKLGNQIAVPYEQNKGDVESTIKAKNLVDIYEEAFGGKKRQKAASSTASTNTGNKGTAAPKEQKVLKRKI